MGEVLDSRTRKTVNARSRPATERGRSRVARQSVGPAVGGAGAHAARRRLGNAVFARLLDAGHGASPESGDNARRRPIRPSGPTLQRTLKVEASTYAEFVREQLTKQQEVVDNREPDPFTTVGFEHEFAGHSGPLEGVSHVTVANSTQSMPFTNVHFEVETDAMNELELVTPPFLLQTIDDKIPVPKPDQVAQVIDLAETALTAARTNVATLPDLLSSLGVNVGVEFRGNDALRVEAEHMSLKSNLKPGDVSAQDPRPILVVDPTKHKGTISTQVNLATNARVLQHLRSAPGVEEHHPRRFAGIAQAISQGAVTQPPKGILATCEQIIISTIAAQLGVFMQNVLRGYQHRRDQPFDFESLRPLIAEKVDDETTSRLVERLNTMRGDPTLKSINLQALKLGIEKIVAADLAATIFYRYKMTVPHPAAFKTAADLTSRVKDVQAVWPKDAWDSVIRGALLDRARSALPRREEREIQKYVYLWLLPELRTRLDGPIRDAVMGLDLRPFLKGLPWSEELLALDVKAAMLAAVDTMSARLTIAMFDGLRAHSPQPPQADAALGLVRETHLAGPSFAAPGARSPILYGHNPEVVGARQDTYLDPRNVQGPATRFPAFGSLLVVESRVPDIRQFVAQLEGLAKLAKPDTS